MEIGCIWDVKPRAQWEVPSVLGTVGGSEEIGGGRSAYTVSFTSVAHKLLKKKLALESFSQEFLYESQYIKQIRGNLRVYFQELFVRSIWIELLLD